MRWVSPGNFECRRGGGDRVVLEARMKKFALSTGAAMVLLLAGCSAVGPCPSAPPANGTLMNLDQCWGRQDIARYYTTSQGSLLAPYRLVMPLDLVIPDPANPGGVVFTGTAFFTRDHIEGRWRFLALEEFDRDERSDLPPEWKTDPKKAQQDIVTGWPVGVTVDVRDSGKPEWRGEWMGFTCSACHTAQVEYKGARLRVEGGPTMADVNLFLQDLQRSLAATKEDGERGGAYYKTYKDNYEKRFGPPPGNLLEQLREVVEDRNRWHKRNNPPIPAGYARLDAFGDIFNAVLELLGMPPSNRARPNAPVSYPFLWDTSHHNWTQWNGYSPAIPIGRNVGQALGVFAKVDPDCGFIPAHLWLCEPSSIRIDNQIEIQRLVDQLRSPKWPDKYFGAPIGAKVEAGRSLFHKHCAHCHGEQKREDPLHGNDMAIIEVEDLGTDPTMVHNTNRRKAVQHNKKFMRSHDELNLVRVQDQAAGVLQDVLSKSALGTVVKEWFWSCFIGRLNCSFARGEVFEAYKGRPLDGIWATAPYLHNGSVPNLFYLLKPPKHRPAGFCVGSREFDPVHVGFEDKKEPDCRTAGLFWLDTTVEGNSNTGHHGQEYGGEFTDHEIESLVEYMKTL